MTTQSACRKQPLGTKTISHRWLLTGGGAQSLLTYKWVLKGGLKTNNNKRQKLIRPKVGIVAWPSHRWFPLEIVSMKYVNIVCKNTNKTCVQYCPQEEKNNNSGTEGVLGHVPFKILKTRSKSMHSECILCCQDPAGYRTTWKAPDHHRETQTEVIWTCFHVSCSSSLAKTILQGGGGEEQGREKKR